MADITSYHELDNILPNFPLFVRLLGFANRFAPNRVAIKDLVLQRTASHIQLLNDVLSLRNSIYQSLDSRTRQQLVNDDEVFFLLLAGPGYDYVVGFLAILALGGVIVPVSPHVPVTEALYFAKKSTAKCLVFNSHFASMARAIQEHVCNGKDDVFPTIETSKSLGLTSLAPGEIHIHPRQSLNPEKAGLVIFTSGTTGRPKAVVLPREMLSSGTQALADHFEISANDVALHCMPVHHIAGITVCFVPFLLSGAVLEFDSFNVERIWARWRQGDLTVFGGVPTMYSRLMRHYEDHLRLHPDREAYLKGLRALRFMMSGTSALPAPVRSKWTILTGGKRILERYGASEYSSAILTPLHDNLNIPDGSVGKVLSGCDLRLAAEGEGEILVKTPGMFLRYHQDPEATRAAFDSNGYYKTGDIGRREGQHWFILGRASIDIIKSGGYKISALDIEREILGFDYISEVSVMGASDEELGQRVAAIIVLRNAGNLTLKKLRDDLRASMSSYKLPTLLYVTEEIPKTASGKVQKKALVKEIFESGLYDGQIQKFGFGRPAEPRARL